MHNLDPMSLMFTNLLVTLVVAVVLLVSRLGLREAGAGVRSWVVGDMMLMLSRTLVVEDDSHMLTSGTTPLSTLAAALFLAGVLWHLQALWRVKGWCAGVLVSLGMAFAPPIAICLASLSLQPGMGRSLLFYGPLLLLTLLSARALWPLRGLWGARLIGGVMVLGLLNCSVRLMQLVGESADAVAARQDVAVVESLLDLVIGLFVSAGFLVLQQERLRERIERLVVTDALTGALNRHGLMPPLERAMAQATRHGRPLSVVLFDLDHFKRVNDEHGHAVGDTVLTGFAARAQAALRGGDLLGRWGGEEFLLVLPDTALDQAAVVAERIRASMADSPVANGAPAVTVSGGAAAASEARAHTEALLQMLKLADQRLYLAKRQRNQVVAGAQELT